MEEASEVSLEVKKTVYQYPDGRDGKVRYEIVEDDIPLDEVNQWLDTISTNSYLTGQSYAYDLLNYLKYLQILRMHYREVTKKATIDGFIKYLLGYSGEGIVELEGKKTLNSIAKNISVLKSFYDWLEDEKSVQQNPIKYGNRKTNQGKAFVKKKFLYGQIFNFEFDENKYLKRFRFKKNQDHLKWYTTDEIQLFIDSFTTIRDRVIFRLSVECGLRISEILGLKKHDIDEDNRIIKIRRNENYENEALAKTHERDVPVLDDIPIVGDDLFTDINNYLIERKQADIYGSPFLFINYQGEYAGLPMRRRNYLKILKKVGMEIGIDPEKIRTHSGRSTRAQDLLEKSVENEIPHHFIKNYMGWASIDTLKDYEKKMDTKVQIKALDKLSERKIKKDTDKQ